MYDDSTSSERPEIIERLRAEIRGVSYHPAKRKSDPLPDPEEVRRLFTVCTGNRWLELGAREQAPEMLFGDFWRQHEICFLFAHTNAGKSILAVQLADAIARGGNMGPFACQAGGARVLYADFELSNHQFNLRYSHQGQDYNFHDHFFRAQFNPAAEMARNAGAGNMHSDDLIIAALECRIRDLNINVLMVDNLSYLGGGTGNAAGALRMINKLHTLRADYNLSVLVLAHTPKRRNPAMPLSADDLHGSKLLMNFADSAFAIGVSNTDSTLRYLKQIKQRSAQQFYGEDRVCLFRIGRRDSLLQCCFEGYGAEGPLLLNRTQLQREKLAAQIAQLTAEGKTQRQISEMLNIGLGTVNRILNR